MQQCQRQMCPTCALPTNCAKVPANSTTREAIVPTDKCQPGGMPTGTGGLECCTVGIWVCGAVAMAVQCSCWSSTYTALAVVVHTLGGRALVLFLTATRVLAKCRIYMPRLPPSKGWHEELPSKGHAWLQRACQHWYLQQDRIPVGSGAVKM
jgi:hypothetical protein